MQLVKVIHTKYIGPTNYRGSRVKATDDLKNSVTLPWDAALSVEANHTRAANKLLKQVEHKHESGLKDDAFTQHVIVGIGSWENGYIFTSTRKTFTRGAK